MFEVVLYVEQIVEQIDQVVVAVVQDSELELDDELCVELGTEFDSGGGFSGGGVGGGGDGGPPPGTGPIMGPPPPTGYVVNRSSKSRSAGPIGGGKGILGLNQMPKMVLETQSNHFHGCSNLLMLKKQPKSILERSMSGSKHTGPATQVQARYGCTTLAPSVWVWV